MNPAFETVAIPPHWSNEADLRYFEELCRANPDKKLERTAQGEILIMAPTGGESGRRNSILSFHLEGWNRRTGQGVTFDSSTVFRLPSGALRSPDAAWIVRDRWVGLDSAERTSYPPLCPDFIVELRSFTDRLDNLVEKMEEWIVSGVRLGWLLDPDTETVMVYRPGVSMQLYGFDRELDGESVLPGFLLDLRELR